MQVIHSKIKGCSWVITRTLQDDKGFFCQTYSWPNWAKRGIRTPFLYEGEMIIQFKHTWRGLYKQEYPYEYATLFRCLHGKALVVAVDMRECSKTYLKHIIIECSEYNKLQLYLEKGFAFGILTLEDNTEFHLKMDAPFSEKHQKRFRWDDPALDIKWPKEFEVDPDTFIMSAFDRHAPVIEQTNTLDELEFEDNDIGLEELDSEC